MKTHINITNTVRMKRNHRTHPDKRITITHDIVMVEYPNGLDATFHQSHPVAKQIMSIVCLR